MKLLSPTQHKRLNEVTGFLLLSGGLVVLLSLVSYHTQDPSFDTAASARPLNLVGYAGSYASDLFFQMFGAAAFLFPLLIFLLSWKWIRSEELQAGGIKIFGAILLFAIGLAASGFDPREFSRRHGGTMRLSHHMRAEPRDNWSARGYARFLPVIEHLPEPMRRRWTYIGLFPNVFFDIYPEWLDFFHIVPTGPGRVRIRARSFGFPDDRREMRAARWLCARLNSRVQAEDEVLTRSVQQGLESGAYTRGILSDKEVVLAGFQDWIRAKLPVANVVERPRPGTMAEHNARLSR